MLALKYCQKLSITPVKWICALLLLINNASVPTLTHFSGIAMTMPYRISIGHSLSFQEKQAIQKRIDQIFSKIHAVYNHYNPDSIISQINRLDAHIPFPLSAELYHVLKETKHLTAATNGYYDPTVGRKVQLWKTAAEQGLKPAKEALQSSKTGWQWLKLKENFLEKKDKSVALDLSGYIKGYTLDLLARGLKALGIKHAYLEWSGDITTIGNHPKGRPWQVLLYLDKPLTVPLCNSSIATSGNTYQRWNLGAAYTHIFDPHLQRPKICHGNTIVSVKATSCALADALATALLLLEDKEKAADWDIHSVDSEVKYLFFESK